MCLMWGKNAKQREDQEWYPAKKKKEQKERYPAFGNLKVSGLEKNRMNGKVRRLRTWQDTILFEGQVWTQIAIIDREELYSWPGTCDYLNLN